MVLWDEVAEQTVNTQMHHLMAVKVGEAEPEKPLLTRLRPVDEFDEECARG